MACIPKAIEEDNFSSTFEKLDGTHVGGENDASGVANYCNS